MAAGASHLLSLSCLPPSDTEHVPQTDAGASHLDWREVTGRWDETKGLTPLGEEVVEKI